MLCIHGIVSVSFYIRRKPPSPELLPRREAGSKPEALSNGKWSGPSPSHDPQDLNFGTLSPKSPDFDDMEEDNQTDILDLDRRFVVLILSPQICSEDFYILFH